jgi:hypothetical protein
MLTADDFIWSSAAYRGGQLSARCCPLMSREFTQSLPRKKGIVQETHHDPQIRQTFDCRQLASQKQAEDLPTAAAQLVQHSSIW